MVIMMIENVIEQIRKRYLLTQAEIAKQAKLSVRSIGSYESGKPIRKLELWKLQAAFPEVFTAQGGSGRRSDRA